MPHIASERPSLRADFPPNPRPGPFTRLVFALCAGAACGGEWNIRRGYMFCKYMQGERLIEPGNWAVFILSMIVGAGVAWWASGRLPRRVRPWTLLPLAISVYFLNFFFTRDEERLACGYMFWMSGVALSVAFFCWDQGTLAWLWRKLAVRRRRAVRRWALGISSLLLVAGTLFVALFLAEYAKRLLEDFYMSIYDYSNLNQSMWTLAHFGYDRSYATTMNYFKLHEHGFYWWGEHFTPVQYFILPFYYPFQRPETLTYIMCVFVALSIPVLLVAVREHLGSWPIAFGLAFAFLFHPVWIRVLTTCFHYETFFAFFFFGAYYFYARRHVFGFVVFLLLAFTTKESMPLGVMAWGATTIVFHRGRRRWGLLMLGLGGVYFYLSAKVVVDVYRQGEAFSTVATRYNHLFADEGIQVDSIGILVKGCLTHPWNVVHVVFQDYRWFAILKVMIPFGFLCLLRPWTIFIFLPTMMMHVLTDFQPQFQLVIYHAAEIIPYCVIATAIALEESPLLLFAGRRRRLLACATAALLISVAGAHMARSYLPSGGYAPKLPPVFKRRRPWGKQVYELLLAIPPDVKIASHGPIINPLSNRRWLLHYDYPEGDTRMLADDSEPMDVRYRHPWEEYVTDIVLIVPRKLEIVTQNEIKLTEMRILLPETMHSGEWELAQPYDPALGLLWMRRGSGGIPNADEILADFFRDAEHPELED